MIRKKSSIPSGSDRSMAVSALFLTGFSPMGFWPRWIKKNSFCTCFLFWPQIVLVFLFYSYDAICTFLELSLDEYMASRNSLMDKDLIAFDSTVFQVLSLPKKRPDNQKRQNSCPVETLIQQTFKGF